MDVLDVGWLGVAGTVPDVEFVNGRPQQVRHEVQVAEHRLTKFSSSTDLVARTVQSEAPAQKVIWYTNIVREFLLEPLERCERTVVVIEEHVVRANLVPLARAVPIEAVLLFLLLELPLVAP